MAITHAFVSTNPEKTDATLVGKANWNDAHVDVWAITSTAVGLTLGTQEYLRVTAACTIGLPSPSSIATGKRYFIKRTYSGASPVILSGSIEGMTEYDLVNQWQYVAVINTGSAYEIIANN